MLNNERGLHWLAVLIFMDQSLKMSEEQHSEKPLSNMAFVMELDDLHTAAGEQ